MNAPILSNAHANEQKDREDPYPKALRGKPQLVQAAVNQNPGIPDREHIFNDTSCRRYMGSPEEDPCKVCQYIRNHHLPQFIAGCLPIDPKEVRNPIFKGLRDLSDDLKSAMEKTPDQKGPVGAVPESADKEYDHDVDVFPECSLSVTAQGNIEVIAEPGRQRNVPPMPEFTDAPGKIGLSEIVHETKSHDLSAPLCNQGVGRKVTVDLYSEEKCGHH